ncbi:hypothetical protein D805_0753 [Bifidobacterium thermophilum RBL67]|uniref:Uncharacterized protein n=1 Tax=Bifidobacterium thermophilum RBL67 TaxID=1254439 RepID=M4RC39_9BIFI|nr:hypothetical protein D805_0753 [Bifidobacterium thermophilum RBL67]
MRRRRIRPWRSYESPTVPSSRISEIERGARNLPELKQRAQTLDNV